MNSKHTLTDGVGVLKVIPICSVSYYHHIKLHVSSKSIQTIIWLIRFLYHICRAVALVTDLGVNCQSSGDLVTDLGPSLDAFRILTGGCDPNPSIIEPSECILKWCAAAKNWCT